MLLPLLVTDLRAAVHSRFETIAVARELDSIVGYLGDASKSAGAVIDGPLIFTAANGRLIEQQFYAHATHPNYGASQGRDQIITTGWAISAAPGSAPRLLDAGSKQGTDVVVRVEVTDARVYSHFALEAYRAEP